MLIPEGITERLQTFTVDVISGTGRPILPRLTVNQLQVASLRDPDLTVDPSEPVMCVKEFGLIQRLKERARAAAYILPEIVPTQSPARWSRYVLLSHQRKVLWRAGGSG